MASLVSGLHQRLWAFSRPRLSRIVYANGGLGDELMLTAVAHAARVAGSPLHILTNLSELWRGNSDPLSVQSDVEHWFYAQRRGWVTTEIIHLAYESHRVQHIARQMAAHIGVELAEDWRPILIPAQSAPQREPRLLVVQNSCRGARYQALTKEWPQDCWTRLSRALRQEGFRLVQLGTNQDPILPEAEDWRGRTTLAEAVAWMRRAICFIGLESGLMHVAAAVHTPAVIIYGGRTRPSQTGYANHTNLFQDPGCAGCALNDNCPNGMRCMEIPVETVLAALRMTFATSRGQACVPPK